MSEQQPDQTDQTERPTEAVEDDDLPEDLVPSKDNPLAGGLEPGETVDDLLDGGKHPEDEEDRPDPI